MADAPDAATPAAADPAAAPEADPSTASTAAASHEAEEYREALESYAELLGDGADAADSAAVRALERQIADHLVDGAAPAAPTAAAPLED